MNISIIEIYYKMEYTEYSKKVEPTLKICSTSENKPKSLNKQYCKNHLFPSYKAFSVIINDKFLENIPLLRRQQMWFMHDSAPAHFLMIVRRHLINCFQEKLIGGVKLHSHLIRFKSVRLSFMRTFEEHDICTPHQIFGLTDTEN